MIQAGIIDPTKVERVALQNAASVAWLLLTTEALVGDLPEEKSAAPAPCLTGISKSEQRGLGVAALAGNGRGRPALPRGSRSRTATAGSPCACGIGGDSCRNAIARSVWVRHRSSQEKLLDPREASHNAPTEVEGRPCAFRSGRHPPHIMPKCRSASSIASRFSGGHGSTRRLRRARSAPRSVAMP